MRIPILVLFLTGGFLTAKAQNDIQITGLDSTNISGVLSSTIFGGCVQISNITYSGSPSAFGVFIDPDSSLGIAQGLVMSTGHASEIAASASMFASTMNNTQGDNDIETMAGFQSYDAAVLEFDFIPDSDTIFASRFIFGSEEYPEWVCSSFNDHFAFFVSGVTTSLPQTNVALIPGTAIPIAINSVNGDPNCGGDFSQYYVDNSAGTEMVFDAHTSLIQLSQAVVPGETYHMKIVVADVGDQVFDSGVLIKSQTFCGNFWYQNAQFLSTPVGGLTYEFENQSYAAESYLWNFGDGNYSTDMNPTHTYASPGNYAVTLTCTNSCQENEVTVNLNAMVTSVDEDLDAAEWSIILNPGSSMLVLRFEGTASHRLNYRILDMTGKVVVSEQVGIGRVFTQLLDVSSLNSGMYLFQLLDGDQTLTKKFIK